MQAWPELPPSRDSKPSSALSPAPSPLPIPARSSSSPCPETGKPAGRRDVYACHYPAPQPQDPSVARPSPLQPLDLYAVVSHLSEGDQNLPIVQKRAKTRGFEFGISSLHQWQQGTSFSWTSLKIPFKMSDQGVDDQRRTSTSSLCAQLTPQLQEHPSPRPAPPRLVGFYSSSVDSSLHRALFITLSAQNTQQMKAQGEKCCSCLPQEYQVHFFLWDHKCLWHLQIAVNR